jgi:hypothetical protein
MKIKNVIAWGFCENSGLEIINELRSSLEISEWISDQEGSSDIYSLLLGRVPLVERDEKALQIFSDFYQKNFLMYCVIINRRGSNYFNLHELINEFNLSYYYFYQLIKEKKPELIIFSNIPHEGPDYILYKIAKIFGVKTLMCYQSLFPNKFFMTTSIADFGLFETIPAVFKGQKVVLDKTHKQKNCAFQEIEKLQAVERMGLFVQRMFKCLWFFKKQTILMKYIFVLLVKFIGKPHKLNINSIVRRFDVLTQRANYEKNLALREIDKAFLIELLSTSKYLVYFPLHYQPELTTAPLGGVFQDQIYAIETLRSILGDEWIILVKENPKQSFYQRDELFFRRLSNIKGVHLINKLFPSLDIIEKARFTATITGTAGWETIKGGKKCLVFGQAWYATLENCLTYHSALTYAELLDFLDKVVSYEKFQQSFDTLLCKAGTGVIDPYYFELTEFNTDKKNAINVAHSIMTVVENPCTIWHAEKN